MQIGKLVLFFYRTRMESNLNCKPKCINYVNFQNEIKNSMLIKFFLKEILSNKYSLILKISGYCSSKIVKILISIKFVNRKSWNF